MQFMGLRSAPELNDTFGVVIDFDNTRGRWRVACEARDGQVVCVRGTNMFALPDTISPQHRTLLRVSRLSDDGEERETNTNNDERDREKDTESKRSHSEYFH